MIIRRLHHPLVIGSGVAGLSVALGSQGATVVSKGDFARDGSSQWAQGGIAAAVGDHDTPEAHAADTISVGAGLSDSAAVHALAEGGPDAIERLLAWGARFDRSDDGDIRLGREAGHSTRRIVHAHGDATGAEVMRAMRLAVQARRDIEVWDHHTFVDLVGDGTGRVIGAVLDVDDERIVVLAPAVVLATGGYGRLWDRSTNPVYVTGDGLAAAVRVGAEVGDLEFVQFHPTALDTGDDPVPLLTEALRGEGAHLVGESGRRFMVGLHPDAELAPRDIVARAVWRTRHNGAATYLDTRSIGPDFPERFPTVFGHARAAGLDPRVDLLPVAPAAHYAMGGVVTDARGRTSLPGLWAVGEVAATGVHGGNRLASNSLLEGLVFGARVARDTASVTVVDPDVIHVPTTALDLPRGAGSELARLRGQMSARVGVVRHAEGLGEFTAWLADQRPLLDASLEGLNARLLAGLVADAALARTESRGAHFRADHPLPDPAQLHRTVLRPVPVPCTTFTTREVAV